MKPKQPQLLIDTSWFHIFKDLIRSKRWGEMSTAAKAVYPVIKTFVNWENGRAFPSIDTLVEYSGMARASVVKALKELESQGLLRKEGEERQRGAYAVVEKFDIIEDGESSGDVTFDYAPKYVNEVIMALKRYAMKGSENNIQIIQIKQLNLQINRDQATGKQDCQVVDIDNFYEAEGSDFIQ